MVEVINDIVIPSVLVVPNRATTGLPTAPVAGTLYYDATANKLVVFTTAWETVTSAE